MNLDGLNDCQKRAVKQTEGPVLIIAGAGSGKTRVLTNRIAYLIDECGISPYNILAITFTNKAAAEMRERVEKVTDCGSQVWVSTFHSTCVRILRRYIDRIGYQTNFTIYDTDDQKSVIRDACKKLNIDTKMLKERTIMSAISSAKDEMISPDEMEVNAGGDYNAKRIAGVYREYQKTLKANNALDFDDLIFKTVELLNRDEEVLEAYQERFRYIMVDEYQDTNTSQFRLISKLAEKYGNLCVVGDDDQSIYKFRGANISNILNFENTLPFSIHKNTFYYESYKHSPAPSFRFFSPRIQSVIRQNVNLRGKPDFVPKHAKNRTSRHPSGFTSACVSALVGGANRTGQAVFRRKSAGNRPRPIPTSRRRPTVPVLQAVRKSRVRRPGLCGCKDRPFGIRRTRTASRADRLRPRRRFRSSGGKCSAPRRSSGRDGSPGT